MNCSILMGSCKRTWCFKSSSATMTRYHNAGLPATRFNVMMFGGKNCGLAHDKRSIKHFYFKFQQMGYSKSFHKNSFGTR